MGDRRVVGIKTHEGELYFYSHNSGRNLHIIAAEALEKSWVRHDDIPYALRMILDYMIDQTGSRDSEYGSGIGFTNKFEDEYGPCPSIEIDLRNWTIGVHGWGDVSVPVLNLPQHDGRGSRM
jgi:hypothetical protein